MYYPRHIESVIKRIARRKSVLVLTGARQTGKSTMLRHMYRDNSYISLDRPLVRDSAKENPSLFFEVNKPPVIVDEIQKAAELFDYIKDIVDSADFADSLDADKNGQFFLTGSQSMKLMKNVSESLAGRAGVVKMLGLSMREISQAKRGGPFLPTLEQMTAASGSDEAADFFNYERIVSCVHKGFFPELYKTESDLRDWSDYYGSYFQTYIEKDIKDVLNIQDEAAFVRFVRAAASLTGRMLNLTAIAEVCGKDVKTVRAWLSVMESSGLVYLLEPYYNNFNKRLLKTPKLYFLDTGLACWLLGWNTPVQLAGGAMWGHIFESFVFSEILKSYYNDGIANPPLYFYRDKDKNEIDLVIEDGDVLYPVEIKTSSDPGKSMVKAFGRLADIPGKKAGLGVLICLVNRKLPIAADAWALPAGLI